MSVNLSEAQKNIENEAIGKHNEKVTYLFLIIYDGSTFCISIILEEFARSFGESYLKNYLVDLVQILFFQSRITFLV